MEIQSLETYGSARGFHRQTLERCFKMSEEDRAVLLRLAQQLKLSENHFRDFLDWLEEIALRDQTSLSDISDRASFSNILSDPRLGRSDKLKRLKEELRRLRFPRLAHTEEEIRKRIKEIGLPPQIRISVPPGLEGGEVAVQIKAPSHEALQGLVNELAGALGKRAMREIFALLSGSEEL